jgi:hypothetical protein
MPRQSRDTAAGPLRDFTAESIDHVTAGPGVCVLMRGHEFVVIGRSTTTRSDLSAHRRGAHGTRTRSATAFLAEEVDGDRLDVRYEGLLNDYRSSHNSNVPPGNRFARLSWSDDPGGASPTDARAPCGNR